MRTRSERGPVTGHELGAVSSLGVVGSKKFSTKEEMDLTEHPWSTQGRTDASQRFRYSEGTVVWDELPTLDDYFIVNDHYRAKDHYVYSGKGAGWGTLVKVDAKKLKPLG